MAAGYVVNVERSAARMFADEEYAAAGATVVAEGSWPQAAKDSIIVGLKELPQGDCMFWLLFSTHDSVNTSCFRSSACSSAHSVWALLQRSAKLGPLPLTLRAWRRGII